ncbi:hypothetical protein CALCODRAFT_225969 [Calocera cornea HHB12733]|uniref:Uncharacterized protein n=1 Tax=Calocera cornea HHB12733 TaxID=1353952 RepID=A0A165C0N5_9BASI|nr:hypothetical protein CALCODRAFT_225969 [Calocera cornea HHB12733]
MAVEGEPRHGEETASEKDGDETIMKALPLPRSANDVVEGQISDLVVQMVPAIFGKCCWLPYQSSAVVTPSNNTIAAIFVNQKASEESIIEVQMRNLFKKQTGWTKKQVERTKSNVDLLLAMARDGNTYAHPDPQHLSDVAKAVGRIRLRRFLLNYLVYRPSTGSPVWTDALRGTMSGQLHLDFSKGDATLPYQLERMPDRIPFWKNIESYVEHFNKSTEDFERALSDRPEDIQGALAAAGRGSEAVIPERLPETTLSMFDVVHEGTVSGRARLAAAPRLLVLFLQLIQVRPVSSASRFSSPADHDAVCLRGTLSLKWWI